MKRRMYRSRREFASVAAAGTVAGAATTLARARVPQSAATTVGDVIDRIRTSMGVEWRRDTVDTLKGGQRRDVEAAGGHRRQTAGRTAARQRNGAAAPQRAERQLGDVGAALVAALTGDTPNPSAQRER